MAAVRTVSSFLPTPDLCHWLSLPQFQSCRYKVRVCSWLQAQLRSCRRALCCDICTAAKTGSRFAVAINFQLDRKPQQNSFNSSFLSTVPIYCLDFLPSPVAVPVLPFFSFFLFLLLLVIRLTFPQANYPIVFIRISFCMALNKQLGDHNYLVGGICAYICCCKTAFRFCSSESKAVTASARLQRRIGACCYKHGLYSEKIVQLQLNCVCSCKHALCGDTVVQLQL